MKDPHSKDASQRYAFINMIIDRLGTRENLFLIKKGLWSRKLKEEEELILIIVLNGSCRYHAHQYTNGTMCDLTNQPRETEV